MVMSTILIIFLLTKENIEECTTDMFLAPVYSFLQTFCKCVEIRPDECHGDAYCANGFKLCRKGQAKSYEMLMGWRLEETGPFW